MLQTLPWGSSEWVAVPIVTAALGSLPSSALRERANDIDLINRPSACAETREHSLFSNTNIIIVINLKCPCNRPNNRL